MAAIAIFCPNAINIIAGINGIEVGQSIVIGLLIAFNDILYLIPFNGDTSTHPATDSHLFSLYLLLPFLGVSFALYLHNAYPARVFVGDTYCYFAGMVFAVVAILGHFSKTLLLLLGPQIFNFIYSAPQLFHILPCPRHRLPRFNPRTGLLEPSMMTFHPDHYPNGRPLLYSLLKLLGKLQLLQLVLDEQDRPVGASNLTVLNLWLVWFGPMREDRLTFSLLAAQAACGVLGLLVRHKLALLVFSEDNL